VGSGKQALGAPPAQRTGATDHANTRCPMRWVSDARTHLEQALARVLPDLLARHTAVCRWLLLRHSACARKCDRARWDSAMWVGAGVCATAALFQEAAPRGWSTCTKQQHIALSSSTCRASGVVGRCNKPGHRRERGQLLAAGGGEAVCVVCRDPPMPECLTNATAATRSTPGDRAGLRQERGLRVLWAWELDCFNGVPGDPAQGIEAQK
jgi:hypothetical protein